MSAFLLDVNVLVALATPDHVHASAAHRWFARRAADDTVATCPITQAGLVRFVLRSGGSWGEASAILGDLVADRHEFWPADVELAAVDGSRIVGHRQVTDAYLASLARSRGGRLLTLDRGLAQVHHDVAALVPV